MIRAITISREYGSGGGTVARMLAERLSWRLIDDSLLTEVARRAQIQPKLAAQYDECLDPWFHRVLKALWQGGYEGVATTVEHPVFDADTMAELSKRVILEAAEIGNCVVVGRGGQCLLQQRPDAFHVSLYAPMAERVGRMRSRAPGGVDLEALAKDTDRRRAAYIRRYFGEDWTGRRLYDLLICTSIGLDRVVAVILTAGGLVPPA
jgi:cytidylate kinase